jgi:hypothetical protein
MSHATFYCISGEIVVTGYAPDGEALRFVADDLRALARLVHGERVRVDVDGSVLLRVAGVEASASGGRRLARDGLLRWLGFTRLAYTTEGRHCVVSEPASVPVIVLAAAADARGRPLAYVFRKRHVQIEVAKLDAEAIDETLLARSANWFQLRRGAACFRKHASMPAAHRAVLRSAVDLARNDRRGLWAEPAPRALAIRAVFFHGVTHDVVLVGK